MRMGLLAFILTASLLASITCRAATPVSTLREMIENATKADNAQGANALVNSALQAEQMILAQHKNPNTCREWEELLFLCQKGMEKHTSPEANKAYMNLFPRLTVSVQAALLEGCAEHDVEKDFQAAAVRWLNQAQHFMVQVAAMDFLGMHRVKEGVDGIVKFLKPTNPICEQIAACRALARIQEPKSIRPLIDFLKIFKTGRLKYESTMALRNITGQKFDADFSAWDNWWKQNEKTFVPVAASDPDYNYELSGETKEQLSYYGISVIENRIVFVFDTSGSMTFGGVPDRFDTARNELKKLIQNLREDVLFNIILFSTAVHPMVTDKPLIPATAANKKAALAFLEQAKPGGGTDTSSALEDALRDIALVNGVETIYLLTDGAPNPMMHSMVNQVNKTKLDFPKYNADHLMHFKYINQFMKVRINTIGIYSRSPTDPKEEEPELMKIFLESLALQSDGAYKEVK